MLPTGYIQDLPDPRDIPSKGAFGSGWAPVMSVRLANMFDRLLVQSAESCVGFSCAEALYASWRAAGLQTPELASPLFIWSNARRIHGDQRNNTGTYLRTAFQQMRKVGVCPESVWTSEHGDDLRKFGLTPSQVAYQAAYDQRLHDLAYYRIVETGEERVLAWKRAIHGMSPVVFGIPITPAFLEVSGTGVIPSPSVAAPKIGGHAMCALGYDERGVFGPNTWGIDWGNGGWFHLSWKYVMDWSIDQWAFKAPPPYFSDRETV
jgi:hypothetical protein